MLGNMKKNSLLYYLHLKFFLWEKEIKKKFEEIIFEVGKMQCWESPIVLIYTQLFLWEKNNLNEV